MKLGIKGKGLSTKGLKSNLPLSDVGKGAPKVGLMKAKGSSKTSKGMKFKVT